MPFTKIVPLNRRGWALFFSLVKRPQQQEYLLSMFNVLSKSMPFTKIVPLNRRGWALFFSLMKKNQKSSQQRGFFAAQAFPCMANKTTGCNYFTPVVAHGPRFSKNLLCPCHRTVDQFYLPSPEAFLLTVQDRPTFWKFIEQSKKEALACQGARPGVWPVRWKRSA
jgi:hypothetical protein